MSWLAIVGVIVQVLQAAGVFDWLANWIKQLLEKWGHGKAAFAGGMPLTSLAAEVDAAFDATRPGWNEPLRRLAHGVCRNIVTRNMDVLYDHTFGMKVGKPIDSVATDRASEAEISLLQHVEGNMHDDFVSMIEDMDSTFGDGAKAAGANTESIFFDGTIINLIRQFKAAGVADWIKWIPVVLQLITTIGPKIAEIWQAIQDAIAAGKTPKDVLSDLVIAG